MLDHFLPMKILFRQVRWAGLGCLFMTGGELELDSGSMVVLKDDFEELSLNFIIGSGRVLLPKKSKKKAMITYGFLTFYLSGS